MKETTGGMHYLIASETLSVRKRAGDTTQPVLSYKNKSQVQNLSEPPYSIGSKPITNSSGIGLRSFLLFHAAYMFQKNHVFANR